MNQKQQLLNLIDKDKYDELCSKIPSAFKQNVQINFSDYLLNKSEQQILDFYSDLINNNNQWTIPKIAGSIIILTSHISDLLIKLIEKRETSSEIKQKIKDFDLHYLILFCAVKYNIPEDYFIQMMELKHFRNMVAHEFNSVMETSFRQAVPPIAKAHLLIIALTQLIKE